MEIKNLCKPTDGTTDTVFYLGEDKVLKVYEEFSDEEYILSLLDGLAVPKILEKTTYHDKKAIIFEKIKGKSTDKYPLEVVKFLKQVHKKTRTKSSKNQKIFTKDYLSIMIEKSGYPPFKKVFDEIDLELNLDGIIHGDLFPDNAKFVGSSLSGVYDWSEACEGDFYFDLAVVAISFGADIDEVLKVYEAKISKDKFLEYIKFAKLYYSVLRYVRGKKDFREFFDEI